MFVFYDWPFPHMCTLQRMQPISVLILGSVFSDYVVFMSSEKIRCRWSGTAGKSEMLVEGWVKTGK